MLQIQDLHFKIGDKGILQGLDLKVSAGERVGIIGPNGSGKTTLFNCLSGYNTPQKGRILLENNDLTRANPSVRALRGFGRLFQNSGIFLNLTVGENILVALESRERLGIFKKLFSSNAHQPRIMELLSRVGLESKVADRAGSLSGGQLRLLEIIRLIAFEAKVFLLDEPTAGVSPKMKGEIINTLSDIVPKEAIVLLIEHDITFIRQFCKRAVVLDSGTIALDGEVDEVRSDERLQKIYFGR